MLNCIFLQTYNWPNYALVGEIQREACKLNRIKSAELFPICIPGIQSRDWVQLALCKSDSVEIEEIKVSPNQRSDSENIAIELMYSKQATHCKKNFSLALCQYRNSIFTLIPLAMTSMLKQVSEHAGKISLRLLLHLGTTKEIFVSNYLQTYYWSLVIV